LTITQKDADQAVLAAFDLIKRAAEMLQAFPYADAAETLRRQIQQSVAIDPTKPPSRADTDDMNRKLRLLDAAAEFVDEWEAVKRDALAAPQGFRIPG